MEKNAVLKKLLRKGSAAAVIRLSSAALNFVALAMVARWLGAEEYGAFALMFSIGVTAGLSATGGRHLLVLRCLPALEQRGEAARLARAGYVFIVLAALAAVLAMVLFAQIDAAALAGSARALLWAGALTLPYALAEYQVHLLRAKGGVVTALAPRDIVWHAAIILLSVVAIEHGASTPRAETAFVWISAILGGLVLLQGALVLRALQLRVGPAPTDAPLSAADRRPQPGWLWASTVAEAMQRNIVVMVAGFFLVASDVGALFSAHRTALLLSLPLIAVNIVAAPMIARAWAQGRPDQVQSLCRYVALIASAPSLLGIGFLALFGEATLSLFSPAYGSAVTALLVLAVANMVSALYGPSGIVLLMTGEEKAYVLIRLGSQAVGLIVVVVGAQYYGLTGAALGGAADMVLWNVLSAWWARRRLGIDPSIVAWLQPRVAG